MIKADITYNMIDVENVHISKEEMSNWLELDDDLQVVFNDEAMEEFVSNFADEYNTEYREHSLTTTWGPQSPFRTEITAGGWIRREKSKL